jgi:hypothetical protein
VQYKFGRVELPRLERFVARGLDTDTVADLARAEWPRLRYLELEFRYGRGDDAAALFGPLLRARFGEDLSVVRIIGRWHQWLSDHLADSTLGRGRKVEVIER